MMKKFDGVIFDMDGLLFDTELIYYTSTQKVADAMGLPYSKEVYLDYVGISDEEVQENYRRIYASYGHVSAAHSAGIPVIMVPDLLQPTEVIQEKTLHVLESLHQAPHYLK